MKADIKKNSFAKKLGIFAVIYLAVALLFFWIVAENWNVTSVFTDTVSMERLLPAGSTVSQSFASSMEILDQVKLLPHFDTAPTGKILLTLSDGDQVLYTAEEDVSGWASDAERAIMLNEPVRNVLAKTLTLTVDPQDTFMALWTGSTVNTGRFNLPVETNGLAVNGEPAAGSLVMVAVGRRNLNGAAMFWPVAFVILAVCIALSVVTHRQFQAGRTTLLTTMVGLCSRYSYLLKTLVWRDFSVKYKSSMLGMLWSFINPLLTMGVYLFVFSTLFKSNIELFPVYLMSGIVLMNYFADATNLGLFSIVGNASLITKVYMPKVIYPLSKVLSACINLCISIIPLLIVMLITGAPFTKSLLLLPLLIFFLLVFSLGVSLILATMNVFFRDVQFLWSVILMMLNFLCPVFYPESIIPQQFRLLYHINPLYQILYFMRTIVIGGISPTAITYLYCGLASGLTLLVGLIVFRKNQDKFVLYL